MSEHRATVNWKRGTPDYKYETYDRTHLITFPGGTKFKGSAAKEYLGKPEFPNPEELLVSAVAGCHMLTFLAIAAKSRITIESYLDEAIGKLDKNAEGKLCVTEVVLNPKVVFSDGTPTREKLKDMHDKSHKHCFIANSIKCKVTVNT